MKRCRCHRGAKLLGSHCWSSWGSFLCSQAGHYQYPLHSDIRSKRRRHHRKPKSRRSNPLEPGSRLQSSFGRGQSDTRPQRRTLRASVNLEMREGAREEPKRDTRELHHNDGPFLIPQIYYDNHPALHTLLSSTYHLAMVRSRSVFCVLFASVSMLSHSA